MMLIGIDHGNKQVKTVHGKPFVSGLQQSVTKPFGKDVLKYQDTYLSLIHISVCTVQINEFNSLFHNEKSPF